MGFKMSSDPLYSSSVSSLSLIETFWKREVCSFKFSHSTSSLYREHFERYGLSAAYPEVFRAVIDKIRVVWNSHLDICSKRYFGDFEQRYDAAARSSVIAMSFTAKAAIIDEFTKGERKGGEWLREMKRFIFYADQQLGLFSPYEVTVIQEMRIFIRSIDEMPKMIVKVSAGSAFWTPLLCPLDLFIRYIQCNCSSWEDPTVLSGYLESTLGPTITTHKQNILDDYETSLSQWVGPEHLEFEVLSEATFERQAIAASSSLLKIGEKVKLTTAQVIELKIKMDGYSDNPDYLDSRFSAIPTLDDCYLVTRMPR